MKEKPRKNNTAEKEKLLEITLTPIGKSGSVFVFPARPQEIKIRSAAAYQSFDIISAGTVKIPKGSDVEGVSWDGEFFGASKQFERIVQENAWKEPAECVHILKSYMNHGTILNLVVPQTLNMDVTISSFQTIAYGGFGNVKYSIEFIQARPLRLYTTEDRFGALKARMNALVSGAYTVVRGDSLWKIARKRYGDGSRWTELYRANADALEAAAKAHGKSSSDHGRYLWPGQKLMIP